jgi:predicted dehydrogenase
MPETVPVNAIQQELETFAESILQDTTPPVSLNDGYEALRLAHRILKEIDKRKAKTLDQRVFLKD